LLTLVAAFVVLQGPNTDPTVINQLGDLVIIHVTSILTVLLALAMVAVNGFFFWHMAKAQGRLLIRIGQLESALSGGRVSATHSVPKVPAAGLPVGTQAPKFGLRDLQGEYVTLDSLRLSGRPTILLFTNPHCGPCQTLMADVGRWQAGGIRAMNVVLISEGKEEENRDKSAQHGVTMVLLQEHREVAEGYLAWGTPAAVLIGIDGTIRSPLAQGADAIRTLVAESQFPARESIRPSATPPPDLQNGGKPHPTSRRTAIGVGDPVPLVKLYDLGGKSVDFASLGRNTLVLFWNPKCGFCAQMLPDVKAWEANPPPGAPSLVMVSTGTIEETRAMDVRSQVLLDPDYLASSAFGANGTPMGIRIDGAGKIASELAAGAVAVLALANLPAQPEPRAQQLSDSMVPAR
jgi:thiol-disulfide isomerase/thioredoxin